MADILHNYDFDAAVSGASYSAVQFQFPEEDGFYLVGTKIYLQLRKKPGQLIAAEFSTENEKLVITGDYAFELPEQIILVPADTWYYDILFVFPDGRRDYLFAGKWPVQPTITSKKS
jgi:hypothetical protein